MTQCVNVGRHLLASSTNRYISHISGIPIYFWHFSPIVQILKKASS